MKATPALVRALLESNKRALYRIGDLPPPDAADDLEVTRQRTHRDQLIAENQLFEAWLEREGVSIIG